jgi:hypothetical protein
MSGSPIAIGVETDKSLLENCLREPQAIKKLIQTDTLPNFQDIYHDTFYSSSKACKKNHMAKVAEIKTKPTSVSVAAFIESIQDEQKRKDSAVIVELMEKATKEKAKMWGTSIVGFGDVRYKSPATGREVDWFKIGFSPRKANLTLYLMGLQLHAEALTKLGKHKIGGGCLYINKLADIDMKVLEKIITAAAKQKSHQ